MIDIDQQVASPRRRNKVKVAVIVIGILMVAVFAVAFGTRFGKDPRLVDSPLIGRPAPPIDLSYLEKPGRWQLDEHLGEIVVVNFWASWCVGCRIEHPALLRTADAYRNRGVVFLGVTFQDDPVQSIAFLDEMGRGYDSVVDPGSRVAIDYGVYGIPETFVIDRAGVVRAKISGESTYEGLSGQLDLILTEGG